MNLVEKCRDGYKLTNLGYIALERILEVEKLLNLIEDVGNFFNTHDIASIPKELRKEIHHLHGGCVVKKESPYDLHDIWIDMLRNSKWIKGVSSIYHPKFPTLFTELAEEGKDIHLILTEDIFKRCKAEHSELLRKFVNSGGKIHTCKEARIAFIVAEKGFTMNLYTSEGYDAANIFVCRNENCIHWGLRLFSHFLESSEEVDLWVCENTHGEN